MSEPERSAVLKRALTEEADQLPGDFAARVAALAETEIAVQSTWTDASLVAAFVAMLGVCVAGWFVFVGRPAIDGGEVLDLFVRAAGYQPWLVIGLAGFAVVQLLTFRRRAMT